MASGELNTRQRAEIDRAIRAAEQASRFEFSVFRGESEGDPRDYARRLHGALATPARSVLVLVDPVERAVEVVTGSDVRRTLDDAQVELAVLDMASAFSGGDQVGGIVRGLAQLAEHARRPETRHVTDDASS